MLPCGPAPAPLGGAGGQDGRATGAPIIGVLRAAYANRLGLVVRPRPRASQAEDGTSDRLLAQQVWGGSLPGTLAWKPACSAPPSTLVMNHADARAALLSEEVAKEAIRSLRRPESTLSPRTKHISTFHRPTYKVFN